MRTVFGASERAPMVRATAARPAVARRVGPVRLPGLRERHAARWTLGGCLLIVGLLRLPWLSVPLGRDEAGIALVAQHWTGGSLYGEYWLDRPPPLVLLFKLAGLRGRPGGG